MLHFIIIDSIKNAWVIIEAKKLLIQHYAEESQ